MKKILVAVTILMSLVLGGCAESGWVNGMSPEYWEDLEFHSGKNVYFGQTAEEIEEERIEEERIEEELIEEELIFEDVTTWEDFNTEAFDEVEEDEGGFLDWCIAFGNVLIFWD